MSTPAIHKSPATSLNRELVEAMSTEFTLWLDYERVEDRYCLQCDGMNDHVVVDDGLESAECVECGFVHDWNV